MIDRLEIEVGKSFRPFLRMRNLHQDKEGDLQVPESYDHGIVFRRNVSLFGIPGCIDTITEDPLGFWDLTYVKNPPDRPLGQVYFAMTMRRSDGQITYNREPFILRSAFLVDNPGQYSKLLNSYAEVVLGKERYLHPWNINRPTVKRNMEKLEAGEQVLVVQKNLLPAKQDDLVEAPSVDLENMVFDRLNFVWLSNDVRPLRRKISFTYWQIEHGEDQEPYLEVPSPNDGRILVTSQM